MSNCLTFCYVSSWLAIASFYAYGLMWLTLWQFSHSRSWDGHYYILLRNYYLGDDVETWLLRYLVDKYTKTTWTLTRYCYNKTVTLLESRWYREMVLHSATNATLRQSIVTTISPTFNSIMTKVHVYEETGGVIHHHMSWNQQKITITFQVTLKI